MEVTVKRIDDAYKMEATNETGEILHMDGSKALGASESAFRPMQLLLTSLGGCSAIDIINVCLLYTSPSPRDRTRSRMPSSA